MKGLALIHSQSDIIFSLKLGDNFEGRQQVRLNPFCGIGQVKKELLPFSGLHGFVLSQQLFPNGRHMRKHRPVDHSDKRGGGPQLLDELVA